MIAGLVPFPALPRRKIGEGHGTMRPLIGLAGPSQDKVGHDEVASDTTFTANPRWGALVAPADGSRAIAARLFHEFLRNAAEFAFGLPCRSSWTKTKPAQPNNARDAHGWWN